MTSRHRTFLIGTLEQDTDEMGAIIERQHSSSNEPFGLIDHPDPMRLQEDGAKPGAQLDMTRELCI